MIKIKRVYDKPARTDAYRALVDRLWPRGVARASLPLAAWLKEAAPSDELRRWFKHDPAKWPEFQRRYRLETRPRFSLLCHWKMLAVDDSLGRR